MTGIAAAGFLLTRDLVLFQYQYWMGALIIMRGHAGKAPRHSCYDRGL
jgi:hypothetical protein